MSMPISNLHEPSRLVRKHIFVNIDDWNWIIDNYGGPNQLGTSKAVRLMIRKMREAVEAKALRAASPVQHDDIELEDDQ